jgi:hypothetical protein
VAQVKKAKSRVYNQRPAPDAACIEVPTKVPRHVYIALQKGEAGYFHTDCAEYTVEGWLKVIEYGIDRYHRDGLEGADKIRGKGLDPNSEAQAHAEHKDSMLRGEEPIRERSGGVPPIVDATRKVLLGVLRAQGVKLPKGVKLGTTVESAWEAAAKALPAIVKNRKVLDAQAQSIASALDLSGIKLDLTG